ncbi:MAG: protein phosphatase 2C domain-containing protein [Anaerolineae bacterium]|nr:protein phosphatase 2C domain-containing protein [Anaerolineae bacterium]
MQNYHIRAGQVIGRDHLLRQANCQDSYALIEHEDYIIGIICDGCSQGERSEVGAMLGAEYLSRRAAQLLEEGHNAHDLPECLYQDTLSFLENLCTLMPDLQRRIFVQKYLLFTVVGVIIHHETSVLFTAGDGLLVIDDFKTMIDQKNEPTYLAYHLVKGHLPPAYQLPTGFECQTLAKNWQRLAIGSDGFELDLVSELWGQSHPRGLQRKLNYWSNQERRFKDDTTLIVIEKGN